MGSPAEHRLATWHVHSQPESPGDFEQCCSACVNDSTVKSGVPRIVVLPCSLMLFNKGKHACSHIY